MQAENKSCLEDNSLVVSRSSLAMLNNHPMWNIFQDKPNKHEPRHDKTNKVTVRPAKTQISLGIRPVWSESSLCAQWVAKDPSFPHADSKDPGLMPRLIWVFTGRTLILLVLSFAAHIMDLLTCMSDTVNLFFFMCDLFSQYSRGRIFPTTAVKVSAKKWRQKAEEYLIGTHAKSYTNSSYCPYPAQCNFSHKFLNSINVKIKKLFHQTKVKNNLYHNKLIMVIHQLHVSSFDGSIITQIISQIGQTG